MKKLRQVPRIKQRISFKQIAVASSLGLATLAIAFTVFNGGMLQSDTARASASMAKAAKENIKQGDDFYMADVPEYLQAIPHYEEAIKAEPENAELNLKLGVCYLNSHNKFKALGYFSKAATLMPGIDPMIHFYLARSFQINSEFDKAIDEYNRHLSIKQDLLKDEARKFIDECKTAKELVANPVDVKIENLGAAVNSMYPDYAPYISANEDLLFYTSRKAETQGGGRDEFDGVFFEDIYMSRTQGVVWQQATNAGQPVNTPTHDAVAGLSSDSKTLFVFKGDLNEGDILISSFENGKWSTPESVGKNINSKYHESTASLSPDKRTLYFVSDRPGSFGGRDIFKSTWDDVKKEWGKAQNLGETINTQYDEEGVFMHPDGSKLYFSSQGHNTMGGYDIYCSKLKDGAWQTPANLGYPVNTPDDDVFYSVAQNGHAYYSSIRKEGFGDKDIYRITYIQNDVARK